MDFSKVPWFLYLVAALTGIGFGALQGWLMKRAVLDEPPRRWLFFLKVGLWAVALVVWAMVSIPLLLAFTVTATLALLSVTWSLYRLARKKVPPCSK